MIAKARRALFPGCEHDWMPILESPQGYGKTSFARVLAGSSDRYTDAPIAHQNERTQQEQLCGRTVHEMGELSDMKQADKEALKIYLSRTHDRAREAYARIPKDQPRRCIYIGTTNESYYLQDNENRRMQPVKVGRVDIAMLEKDRDQLHAEAYAAVLRAETAVIPSSLWDDATKEQNKRRINDPWEDIIGKALQEAITANANTVKSQNKHFLSMIAELDHKGRKVWFVSSESVMSDILRIDPRQQHGYDGKRVVAILTGLGWARIRLNVSEPRRAVLSMSLNREGSTPVSGASIRPLQPQTGTRTMKNKSAGGYSKSAHIVHIVTYI